MLKVIFLLLTSSVVLSTVLGSIEADAPVPVHCGVSHHHFQQHHTLYGGGQNAHIPPLAKRILGGQESGTGEWPWLVSLMAASNATRITGAYDHLCGGSLIAPQWVLSAGHCFGSQAFKQEDKYYDIYNVDTWRVRLGEHYLAQDEDHQIDLYLEDIIRYPGYYQSKRGLFNDIVLLKLERPVRLNEYINVVCLPSAEDVWPSGTECLAAGWGHSTEGGELTAAVNHVQLNVVHRTVCRRQLATVKFSVTNNMTCAGSADGTRDSCHFDSGGPLVVYNQSERRWIQAGIVSFGFGCGRQGFPGVYTNVARFVDWIETTIAQDSRDSL